MTKNHSFSNFYWRLFAIFIGLVLVNVVIGLLNRIFLLWQFGTKDVVTLFKWQTLEALSIGFLFDVKMVGLLFAPVYLVALIYFSPPLSNRRHSYLSFLRKYSLFILFFSFFFGVCNYFYYWTYQNHFDDFVFAIVDGEPLAVLLTIWRDYPVVIGPIIVIFVFYFFSKFFTRLLSRLESGGVKFASLFSSKIKLLTVAFLSFCLFFIAARGSVVVLPLTRNWARVSSLKIINDVIPNAPFALLWAASDHFEQKEISPADLDKGFRLHQSFLDYFGGPPLQKKNWQPADLFANTPVNVLLREKPPQVVFVLLEGWGSHLLNFQSEKFDILSTLKEHFQSDYVFSRFISGGEGTFPSLIRLLISSRHIDLPKTKYRNKKFSTSITRPFLAEGYKVYFLSSGNAAWRSLDKFLPALGFDKVIDAVVLKRLYPEAATRTWGVDDEYVYQEAIKILTEARAKGEKVFLFVQTISNHPPYEVPVIRESEKLDMPKAIANHFVNTKKSKVESILKAYQYGNYSFGNFLSRLKADKWLSENTIVAASGDHNLRELKYKSMRDYGWWQKTPFYVYAPSYLKPLIKFDDSRIGSHRDIFPTLYHLSLSNAKYLDVGQNLFSESFNEKRSIAIGDSLAMDTNGLYYSKKIALGWHSDNKQIVDPKKLINGEDVFTHIKTYNQLLDWLTSYQVANDNNNLPY